MKIKESLKLLILILLLIIGCVFFFSKNKAHALQGDVMVCPNTTVTLEGSDIFDGDISIDWSELQTQNIKFIFIKATQGKDFVNALYAGQRGEATQNNIKYSSYHYFNPKDDPLQQARLFLQTVGPFDHQQLPPMLDWEDSGDLPPEIQIKNVKIWLSEVEKVSGTKPIIYISPAFFNSLGNPQDFQDYPLFIAHYDVSCPSIPPIWANWVFWQKGNKSLPGIPHRKSDTDIFNGNQDDLEKFISQAWGFDLTIF